MKFYVYILNIQMQLYEKQLCSCEKMSSRLQCASILDYRCVGTQILDLNVVC